MAVSFGIEVEGAFRIAKARSLGFSNPRRDQYVYLERYLRETGERIANSGVDGALERAQPLLNAFQDSYGHADFPEGAGWKVTSDVSVYDDRGNPYSGGGFTFEIVSPVLAGKHALDQCSDLLRALVAAGAYVGQNSGQHVHFGVMDKSWFSWNKFGPFANNLNDIYSHFMVDVMNWIQPRSRRERCTWIQYPANDDQPPFGNSAAYFLNLRNEQNLRGIVNRRTFQNGLFAGNDQISYRVMNAVESERDGLTNNSWRYKTINWTTSMWRNGTVEFRQGMATMSPLHTIRWVRLLRRMYTWAYAPEYREGGRYYEKPLSEYPTTVEGLCDILRIQGGERRYWIARWQWYKLSRSAKLAFADQQGISRRSNTDAERITKARKKWFIVNNANQY